VCVGLQVNVCVSESETACVGYLMCNVCSVCNVCRVQNPI
jgi:hypothetical protein